MFRNTLLQIGLLLALEKKHDDSFLTAQFLMSVVSVGLID